VSGGHRWARRCALVGRLATTKVKRSWVGTVFSKLVIDNMSNPSLYCSRASPKVQCSGPDWTRNFSTQVERRPCRTRRGSLRAPKIWMDDLSPGASPPLRGSFDGCGTSALGARLPARGPCFALSGEVQKNAGAVCTVGSRVGSGSLYERSLYEELFGCTIYSKRGGSVGEGAPILAHHGSPAGGDRVIGPLRISKLLV